MYLKDKELCTFLHLFYVAPVYKCGVKLNETLVAPPEGEQRQTSISGNTTFMVLFCWSMFEKWQDVGKSWREHTRWWMQLVEYALYSQLKQQDITFQYQSIHCLVCDNYNRPLPNYLAPLSQSEAWYPSFHISHANQTHFQINGCAPDFALTERLRATRKTGSQRWKNYYNATYLPFLIVFRPTKGSNTGSMFSPIFSMSTQSPFATARSMASRYL